MGIEVCRVTIANAELNSGLARTVLILDMKIHTP